MALVIWSGAVTSLIGLAGLMVCIFRVMKAKKSTADEHELRAAVRDILPLNLGSLFLSVLGLMAVVVGILLG